jgi:nitronate monooxygenase
MAKWPDRRALDLLGVEIPILQAPMAGSNGSALAIAVAVLTNIFTGRPARGFANRLVREVGPMSDLAPAFPRASAAIASLRARSDADFAPMWSGQAVAVKSARGLAAGELTTTLEREALAALAALHSNRTA